MAAASTVLLLGCVLALSLANPAPPEGDSDWKFEALENELKAVFADEEELTVGTRNVEEVEGAPCGWFERVDGKSLYGYNTKTVYDIEADACMELCAYEYNFYCRSADYNTGSMTCYLSSESDETQPADFGDNFNTVYFRRHCEDPTPEASGSGWWYG